MSGDHEAGAVARIREERLDREWSLERMAREMTDHGHHIHGTALFNLEHGERRLNLNELIGFSEAFGIPVTDLIPGTTDPKDTSRRLVVAERALRAVRKAVAE